MKPIHAAGAVTALALLVGAGVGVLLFQDSSDEAAPSGMRQDNHQGMDHSGGTDKAAGGGPDPGPGPEGFYAAGPFRLKVEPGGETFQVGENRVTVILRNAGGEPLDKATVRAVAERAGSGESAGKKTAAIELADAGDGRYRGTLTLDQAGPHALAVDAETPDGDHGDLVLRFRTGKKGLTAATATPEGVAYYTCSMHSSVRKSEPGQCPICGMDLVPVSKEQVESGVIQVDAERRQLIGVETGPVERRALTKNIRAVGRVDYDERRISDVTLKFDAWISELQADFVGKQVTRGEPLFSAYSPKLLSAQQEYLETRRRLSRRDPDDSLLRAARKRLMLWDIAPAQVRALERRGEPFEQLPIEAPATGTVVEKMVVNGSHVQAGQPLLRIADLSQVWVDAEVYESDLPLIETGMDATVTLPYLPDAELEAEVDYVYPTLEGRTRTGRIRLVLDNPEGRLKPDMYAQVMLHADLGERLVVPREAVIVAGETRVVFKDLGAGGKLEPVRVETGQRTENWIEVTQGLSAGDTVVTSGNFLIASEAKLQTGIEQW